MFTTRLNFPVNAAKIGFLVADHSDLQLMWPSAQVPFDEAQWLEKLDPSTGTLSYWFMKDYETVGHFALKHAAGDPQVWLLNVYLLPEVRRTGASKELLKAAEKLAADVMFGETLCLKVRSYNTAALKLYLAAGYTEFHREGDLLQMSKALAPSTEVPVSAS
jgi:GNAT superfamily N-acetyltransferase